MLYSFKGKAGSKERVLHLNVNMKSLNIFKTTKNKYV